MEYKTIIKMYESSFRANFDKPALTEYFTGESCNYLQLAEDITRYHILFNQLRINKGDKIALVGKNNTNWVKVYIAVITYGAVIVPILADFHPADLLHTINHSDSKLLFTEQHIWNNLPKEDGFENLIAAFNLSPLEVLYEKEAGQATKALNNIDNVFNKRYLRGFSVNDINYDDRDPNEVMIINYTSGTTGFSKGVMLSVDNITANVCFAIDHKFHFKGSRVLALLPLAHAYGCAFDMLTPLSTGSHITLLGRIPTPSVLMEAMVKVKPNLICTVPIVMEKIVIKKVFPQIEKKPIKTLIKIPIIRGFIYKKILKSMLDSFGGCVIEVNMGGAALNTEVESFLRKIKFPFTVGYGMTECAPLICYEVHQKYKPQSCGKVLPGMEVKIVPVTEDSSAGEIYVKGRNVMKGYYKNEEATATAIDAEGWLHTGDIGVLSDDNTVFIKGRIKSMILSANGQNIYPEEIESKLNKLNCVTESLVVEEKGKLFGLIVPDFEKIKIAGISLTELKEIMMKNLEIINSLVAPYEKLCELRICKEAFEKTPKQSIRRYLYPQTACYMAL